MNHNQQRQRKKLKELLIWSVVMTFINQVSSIFLTIPFVFPSKFTWSVLYMIGQFDPAVNIWTTWLMITSNRQHLRRLCAFICRKDNEVSAMRKRQSMSGLTNVPGRSAILSDNKGSEASISVASLQMSVLEENSAAQIPRVEATS